MDMNMETTAPNLVPLALEDVRQIGEVLGHYGIPRLGKGAAAAPDTAGFTWIAYRSSVDVTGRRSALHGYAVLSTERGFCITAAVGDEAWPLCDEGMSTDWDDPAVAFYDTAASAAHALAEFVLAADDEFGEG